MNKILIADLYGTLVSEDDKEIFWTELGYYDSERNMRRLSDELNPYLSNDNYLYIVSSVAGHDSVEFIYNDMIRYLYRNLDDNIKKRVKTNFVGYQSQQDQLSKLMKRIEQDSGVLFEDEDGLIINFLNSKSEVFNIVTDNHKLKDSKLFIIGNDFNDFDMLMKGKDLGGEIAIIGNYKDFKLQAGLDAKKSFYGYCKLKENLNNLDLKSWEEFDSAYYKYMKEFNCNDTDDEEQLKKEGVIYNLVANYIERAIWNEEYYDDYRSALESLNIPTDVRKIPVYLNFSDYCSKVLCKRKN